MEGLIEKNIETNSSENLITENQKLLTTLVHIFSSFVGLIALIAYIVVTFSGEKSSFVKKHVTETFNFQFMFFIFYCLILVLSGSSLLLMMINPASIIAGFLLSTILLPLLAVVNLIFSIIAGIKGYKGEEYKYPVSFRIFR